MFAHGEEQLRGVQFGFAEALPAAADEAMFGISDEAPLDPLHVFERDVTVPVHESLLEVGRAPAHSADQIGEDRLCLLLKQRLRVPYHRATVLAE